MKNRGQITVFFSCIISVLLLLTLSALEVGRIYCGKMKIRAVIHSARSSILADYNRELFERYHLLFMDPTYGTGSRAMVEEKFEDYLKESLSCSGLSNNIYGFEVSDIALVDCKTIMDDHMRLLKNEIVDYEKEAGAVKKIVDSGKQMVDSSKEVKEASEKTTRNATEIPTKTDEAAADDSEVADGQDTTKKEEVEDPREKLKNLLSMGLLALLLPSGTQISDEKKDFSGFPSKEYVEKSDKEKDAGFGDVTRMVEAIDDSNVDGKGLLSSVGEKAAFCAYVDDHFSHQGEYKDSVMKCEAEYIIKGKDSDHDNLEAVLSDIIWMRMPVNYVCLLQDAAKQSEALTLATAICSSTGTMPMVEIVKYLLLGCWSYAESIYEVRLMMQGDRLPYVKTSAEWNTDLKSLGKSGQTVSSSVGMSYVDYLNIMLAKKENKDITYARLLDMVELNLKQNDEKLSVVNLCGEIEIQGKVTQLSTFMNKGKEGAYEYYFQEKISYDH